jgi:2-polyprenyl-6-methoxyphenol hydroxylase-like FAD-dependent oxidoreductase
MDEQVLIVGAGPTGLVLALWLTKLGIPLRIIDKDSGPGQTSRALVLHARTLEFYQQIGIAEEIVAKGIIIENINIRKNGEVVAAVAAGPLGKDLSPFPFILSFPQDDHEKLLIDHLQKAGVFVERNTELVSFREENNQVVAQIKKQDQTETITTPFLFGCDGARSTVRTTAAINFPGGTYSQLFYVADVFATGDVVNGYLQLCLSDADFALAFPIRSSGSIRLIGIVPQEKQKKETIEFADVAEAAIRDTKITVEKVNWFSTYHSHHRVADHFRKGRVFLLGDAGHIHSPVGGQGMNTGIGDAVNLAWKIAALMQNRAVASILDSYELERIGFARRLILSTDKMFQAVTNQGLLGKFVRNIFFPHIIPRLFHFEKVKHFLFNTVSQIKINYRKSPLSRGAAGKIRGGDRLPWVRDKATDNFKSLQLLDWQIHIYGESRADFKESITALGLKLNEFLWNEEANKAGLEKNAVYLIRPDGYVAYASSVQDSNELENFLSEIKVGFK